MADKLLPSGSIAIQNRRQTTMPTYTYQLDLENGRVKGFTDRQEAMEQAILKCLMTWQNAHDIYTPAYGLAMHGLMGRDAGFVESKVKRRIKEALMVDKRIQKVNRFQFDKGDHKDALLASFTVSTRFGDYRVNDLEVRT